MIRALPMLLLLACNSAGTADKQSVATEPAPIGLAECGVCNMVVAEQPAPRGQVLHRDGTHVHFCSLGDMRAYVQAPGPRGKPIGAWVEGLEAGFDPTALDVAERSWIPAEEAHFVVGFERAVMGRPSLSFADAGAATTAAERLDARRTGLGCPAVHTVLGGPTVIVLILAACSASDVPLAPDELHTDTGLYHLALSTEPDPPVADDFTLRLDITSGGEAVEEATLTVEPWMPAHGHGVLDDPVVSELGGGAYQADWAWAMPGYWEVTLTIDAKAGVDTAVVAYEVE